MEKYLLFLCVGRLQIFSNLHPCVCVWAWPAMAVCGSQRQLSGVCPHTSPMVEAELPHQPDFQVVLLKFITICCRLQLSSCAVEHWNYFFYQTVSIVPAICPLHSSSILFPASRDKCSASFSMGSPFELASTCVRTCNFCLSVSGLFNWHPQSYLRCCKWHDFTISSGQTVFLRTHNPFLYAFIHWWTP